MSRSIFRSFKLNKKEDFVTLVYLRPTYHRPLFNHRARTRHEGDAVLKNAPVVLPGAWWPAGPEQGTDKAAGGWKTACPSCKNCRQSIRYEAKAEQGAPLARPGAGACSGQQCKACRVPIPGGGGGC